MTYDTLFIDLKSVYDYFLTVFGRLIDYINNYPLLILGIFVTVSLPSIYFIVSLISYLSESTDDVTAEGFRIYKVFKNKKQKKEEKEMRESFRRDKEFNKQLLYNQGKLLANTFFSNNPQRMSIRINGFTYYQDGFENKRWGNSKKTRVTKKYKIDQNGGIYLSNQSISSTETYDNTSSQQLDDDLEIDP